MLFNNLRGKAGSTVFARSKDGTVVKPRIHGKNPKTPAQVAVRAALSKASFTYKNLTPTNVTAWTNYAATIYKHDVRTAKVYNPSAINAFTALTSKFYLVNPTGSAPLNPPTAPYPGDSITVTATGATGQVQFTASAANNTYTKTELLLQPLKSRNRTPQPKGYRSKGFVAFATGSLTSNVSVSAGWYFAAYRFVNGSTGQQTAIIPIGYVQVS